MNTLTKLLFTILFFNLLTTATSAQTQAEHNQALDYIRAHIKDLKPKPPSVRIDSDRQIEFMLTMSALPFGHSEKFVIYYSKSEGKWKAYKGYDFMDYNKNSRWVTSQDGLMPASGWLGFWKLLVENGLFDIKSRNEGHKYDRIDIGHKSYNMRFCMGDDCRYVFHFEPKIYAKFYPENKDIKKYDELSYLIKKEFSHVQPLQNKMAAKLPKGIYRYKIKPLSNGHYKNTQSVLIQSQEELDFFIKSLKTPNFSKVSAADIHLYEDVYLAHEIARSFKRQKINFQKHNLLLLITGLRNDRSRVRLGQMEIIDEKELLIKMKLTERKSRPHEKRLYINLGYLVPKSISTITLEKKNGRDVSTEQIHKQAYLPLTIIADLEIDEIFKDPFKVESTRIYGDVLEANISYEGGCGDPQFRLIWDEKVRKRKMAGVSLTLDMYSDDICSSIIKKTLLFDISELKEIKFGNALEVKLNGKSVGLYR